LAKDDHPPSKPEDERQAISRIEAVRAQFSGPIPPPSILEAYEKLAAGSADRLIRMAEEEAVHRRSLESQALDSDIQDREAGRKEARFGQVCGLAIGLAAIGCGTYAAVNGAPGGRRRRVIHPSPRVPAGRAHRDGLVLAARRVALQGQGGRAVVHGAQQDLPVADRLGGEVHREGQRRVAVEGGDREGELVGRHRVELRRPAVRVEPVSAGGGGGTAEA